MNGINLTGKGHIAYCEECHYVGKPNVKRGVAQGSLTNHLVSPAHRLNLLRRAA